MIRYDIVRNTVSGDVFAVIAHSGESSSVFGISAKGVEWADWVNANQGIDARSDLDAGLEIIRTSYAQNEKSLHMAIDRLKQEGVPMNRKSTLIETVKTGAKSTTPSFRDFQLVAFDPEMRAKVLDFKALAFVNDSQVSASALTIRLSGGRKQGEISRSLSKDIMNTKAARPRLGARIGGGLRSPSPGMVFVDVTGAIDADTDGIVFEGTPMQRPIIPRMQIPAASAQALAPRAERDAARREIASRRGGMRSTGGDDTEAQLDEIADRQFRENRLANRASRPQKKISELRKEMEERKAKRDGLRSSSYRPWETGLSPEAKKIFRADAARAVEIKDALDFYEDKKNRVGSGDDAKGIAQVTDLLRKEMDQKMGSLRGLSENGAKAWLWRDMYRVIGRESNNDQLLDIATLLENEFNLPRFRDTYSGTYSGTGMRSSNGMRSGEYDMWRMMEIGATEADTSPWDRSREDVEIQVAREMAANYAYHKKVRERRGTPQEYLETIITGAPEEYADAMRDQFPNGFRFSLSDYDDPSLQLDPFVAWDDEKDGWYVSTGDRHLTVTGDPNQVAELVRDLTDGIMSVERYGDEDRLMDSLIDRGIIETRDSMMSLLSNIDDDDIDVEIVNPSSDLERKLSGMRSKTGRYGDDSVTARVVGRERLLVERLEKELGKTNADLLMWRGVSAINEMSEADAEKARKIVSELEARAGEFDLQTNILNDRFGGMNLQEVADKYGMTRENVRRLEASAMRDERAGQVSDDSGMRSIYTVPEGTIRMNMRLHEMIDVQKDIDSMRKENVLGEDNALLDDLYSDLENSILGVGSLELDQDFAKRLLSAFDEYTAANYDKRVSGISHIMSEALKSKDREWTSLDLDEAGTMLELPNEMEPVQARRLSRRRSGGGLRARSLPGERQYAQKEATNRFRDAILGRGLREKGLADLNEEVLALQAEYKTLEDRFNALYSKGIDELTREEDLEIGEILMRQSSIEDRLDGFKDTVEYQVQEDVGRMISQQAAQIKKSELARMRDEVENEYDLNDDQRASVERIFAEFESDLGDEDFYESEAWGTTGSLDLADSAGLLLSLEVDPWAGRDSNDVDELSRKEADNDLMLLESDIREAATSPRGFRSRSEVAGRQGAESRVGTGSKTRIETSGSNAVEDLTWDDKNKELIVTFKGGRTYTYKGVDDDNIIELETSDDALGRLINGIKQRGYEVEPGGEHADIESLDMPAQDARRASGMRSGTTWKPTQEGAQWQPDDDDVLFDIHRADDGSYEVTLYGGTDRETGAPLMEINYPVSFGSITKAKQWVERTHSRRMARLAADEREIEAGFAAAERDGMRSRTDQRPYWNIPVTGSSALQQASYDENKRELTVTFASGQTYTYEDIDFDELPETSLTGRMVNELKKSKPVRKGGTHAFDPEYQGITGPGQRTGRQRLRRSGSGTKTQIPVSGSSAIEALTWDDNKKDLIVTYNGGRTYTYKDVDDYWVDELEDAPNETGRIINNIKKDGYRVETGGEHGDMPSAGLQNERARFGMRSSKANALIKDFADRYPDARKFDDLPIDDQEEFLEQMADIYYGDDIDFWYETRARDGEWPEEWGSVFEELFNDFVGESDGGSTGMRSYQDVAATMFRDSDDFNDAIDDYLDSPEYLDDDSDGDIPTTREFMGSQTYQEYLARFIEENADDIDSVYYMSRDGKPLSGNELERANEIRRASGLRSAAQWNRDRAQALSDDSMGEERDLADAAERQRLQMMSDSDVRSEVAREMFEGSDEFRRARSEWQAANPDADIDEFGDSEEFADALDSFAQDMPDEITNAANIRAREWRGGMRSASTGTSSQRQRVASTDMAAARRGMRSRKPVDPGISRSSDADGRIWASLSSDDKATVTDRAAQREKDLLAYFKRRYPNYWAQVMDRSKNSKWKKSEGWVDEDTPITQMIFELDSRVRKSQGDPNVSPAIKKELLRNMDDLRALFNMRNEKNYEMLEHLHPASRSYLFDDAKRSDGKTTSMTSNAAKRAPSTFFSLMGEGSRAPRADEAKPEADGTTDREIKGPRAAVRDRAVAWAEKMRDSVLYESARRKRMREMRNLRKQGVNAGSFSADERAPLKPVERKARLAKRALMIKKGAKRDVPELAADASKNRVPGRLVTRGENGELTISNGLAESLASALDAAAKHKALKKSKKKAPPGGWTNEDMAYLWEGAGFNGTPMPVSREQFDKLIEAGWTPIVRGHGLSPMSARYADDYIDDPVRFIPGTGGEAAGPGDYHAIVPQGQAWYGGYTSSEAPTAHVALLPPDTRRVKQSELARIQKDHRPLATAISAFDAGLPEGERSRMEADEYATQLTGYIRDSLGADYDRIMSSEMGQIVAQLMNQLSGASPSQKRNILDAMKFLNGMAGRRHPNYYAPLLGYDTISVDERELVHNRTALVVLGETVNLGGVYEVHKKVQEMRKS